MSVLAKFVYASETEAAAAAKTAPKGGYAARAVTKPDGTTVYVASRDAVGAIYYAAVEDGYVAGRVAKSAPLTEDAAIAFLASKGFKVKAPKPPKSETETPAEVAPETV